MSAAVRGSEVFDGDTKIADIVREKNKFAHGGFVLCLVPLGEPNWRKYMGQSPDAEYIAQLFACSICGGCATTTFMEPMKSRLIAKRVCSTCDHWQELIEKDATVYAQTAVRVGGRHYVMGKNTARDHDRFAGFYGDVWHIRFFDGRTARCNNLWSQGEIPERWRAQLPDNAEFVREAS